MKTLRILLTGFMILGLCGMWAVNAVAETRTLTTTLFITVRPETPKVAGAPQGVQEAMNTALSTSDHEQFARMTPGDGKAAPSYTMMEKL